ncbi:N-glycosylase/DNA lyase [Candidatus Woesearchaeota archaeon]|nr:N-glycosylase/DNA lyase [Candidatus Woesearchaeota archaeon]
MDNIEKLKIEYINKKHKIQERLNQFEKFFSEPYSWFYRNGELVLLPVETKDDYRIFEELCFCIFTANASAEMGLKSVDAIRNILMIGTADEMSRRIEGIHRFSNVRPKYIAHTRNHLKNTLNFQLKEKIKSFKNRNELRNFFALNKDIKGLGMKEASHFLRNIGFKGYAILDKHIINSLHEFGVIEKNEKPKNAKEYLEIEQKFIEFSKQLGIDMDELDLLLWSMKNGRILK